VRVQGKRCARRTGQDMASLPCGPARPPPWAAHGVLAPFAGVTSKPPALPEVMTSPLS
jgi:hypothetical protein